MFCTITSLVVLSTETSIDFYDLLMTSSSSSGDFSSFFSRLRGTSSVWRNPCSFQPAVTLAQLELICHHFHQLGNTSFSNLISRIGFWDSRILPSPLLEQLDHNCACCWHCSFFHGSWSPIPGCFSSSWVLGSRPWLFFFLHVHCCTCFIKPTTRSLGVLSSLLVNLPLTHWLTASVCLATHRRLRSGLCFVLQAHAAEYFSCIAVSPRFRVSLHATLLFLRGWLAASPAFTLSSVATP